jgi:hypothetical protein
MEYNVSIEALKQMNIGEIRQLEESMKEAKE